MATFNPNPPVAKYTATAGQDTYPFIFRIYFDTDLLIYAVPIGADPEAAVPLVVNVDYTVTIDGDNGGVVTLTVPSTLNDEIVIYRDLDVTRYIEYQTSGDLLAEVLNEDQNYQTYLIADLENKVREELTGQAPGTSSDYVRKTGDVMSGHLQLIDNAQGNQAISAKEAKPAGVGFDHYGSSAPIGALACNGQEVLKADYTALYSAIGDLWATTGGVASPAVDNFRLPPQQIDDLGLYNRGVGTTNGVVGTYQEDVLKEHNHSGWIRSVGVTGTANSTNCRESNSGASLKTDTNEATGDSVETRPRSITVLKCIWTGK